MNAVNEGETQAYIDVHVCNECGICARNCPSKAIVYVNEVNGEMQKVVVETKQIVGPAVMQ